MRHERPSPDSGPRTPDPGGWQFWIDRGGTFTDVVALGPNRKVRTLKLLSQHPELYEDAALEGIRRTMKEEDGAFDPQRVSSVRMGSTVATNALLEGTGEPTLLVITQGFGDALRIGYQERPDLFARQIVLPPPLYAEVLEAKERITGDGETIVPLDEASLRAGLAGAYDRGFRAAAIVFMHGYRFPAHEMRAADLAREAGFAQVSTSHESAPLIKLISRGDTTVVDAHLTPALKNYVRNLRDALGDTRLHFMQSNGGLARADQFRGKDAVLSGPAGGVIGMATVGREAGFERLIGFDMGGTSTDVSLYDHGFKRADAFKVGGVRIRSSALEIHTVAAGGGSMLGFDGMRLRVEDRSAGAIPGPACYGRGGPLAVTDCHVQLGRLRPEFFPRVLGQAGDQELDTDAAHTGFSEMARRIESESGVRKSPDELAADFLRIAVQKMAQAIRRISIERGHDPEDFVLVPFGGAAGQHACLVADELGIRRILVHPFAGVLSAFGIGCAEVSHVTKRTVERPLSDKTSAALAGEFDDMEARMAHLFDRPDGMEVRPGFMRRVYLRYEGTDTPIAVSLDSRVRMREQLDILHRRQFGFGGDEAGILIDSLELEGRLPSERQDGPDLTSVDAGGTARPLDVHDVWIDGSRTATPFYHRSGLTPESRIEGPAVIVEENAATVVETGWEAVMRPDRNLLITRQGAYRVERTENATYDPTRLEIFNNLFRQIAEEMGIQLGSTARSVNIRERLDYSCAVFDGDGDLVTNAPHIPVHIGSMSQAVRHIRKARLGRMRPGDAYLTNDPFHGGTHLPDLTVVSPYFTDSADEPAFFVASRAHHAEIGGISPGSMPAASVHIDEEGVLFTDFHLVEAGRFNEDGVRRHIAAAKWPSRNPDTNVADLKAQVAANQRGLDRLREAAAAYGIDTVRAYMAFVKANAAEAVRKALAVVDGGRFEVEMDTGQRVAVAVVVDKASRAAVVDFTGTSPQGANNLNAPSAVCTAAVLYVVRLLVDDDIPLNSGCLDPIELRLPQGSMLNPAFPAAVAGGNVETSQCIVDALLGALGIMAASQGTMNNLTFGDEADQYYETICGGSGAGPGFDGASAVHTHMTNSRLTDPEVLESRFPVLLEEFSIRRGSGGVGRWTGGDGVVRRFRFRRTTSVSILSNRRRTKPFGLSGGEAGSPGVNRLQRARGSIEELESRTSFDAATGDVLVIETPGGGGFGQTPPV